MKKILACVTIISILYGCAKSSSSVTCTYDPCNLKVSAAEILRLKDSISYPSNATQHCSGLLYQILDSGSGKTATPCSVVNVTYVGRFNDSLRKPGFDSSTITISLASVIPGWRNGVPLIKENGHILLYIPPTLGYGSSDYYNIPGNSNLYFDVRLNSVQ